MSKESATIVQKLWNYCDVLLDDGVSYGDYVEQLTYLVFLKMAEESSEVNGMNGFKIPDEYEWKELVSREGEELERHYKKTLEDLGKSKGMLGVIFRKAQNKIRDPAKLNRLIKLIHKENWHMLDMDVKGDIYEGLLEKNAQDKKSGAGQYFTPRPLIKAMVSVMKPKPMETIHDPACGTGGFILAAHQYLSDRDNYSLDRDEKKFLRRETFSGVDLVNEVVRLSTMNLFLHGIGDTTNPPILVNDSLLSDPGDRYDLILTNPPFGKKTTVKILDETGKATGKRLSYSRDDFWITSSNKQLNFVQHIKTIMKINGRAAVVVPDNVLFEGGAGETIRRKLLDDFDLHTILRLPTGIFYAQGVKANVIFFDKKPASADPWTQKVWYYDLRTNKKFTLKTNPLKFKDLEDFINCYQAGDRSKREDTERFKPYTYEEIVQRDKVSLDIFWLKDESLEDLENLPPPEEIAYEIVENLQVALDEFSAIYEELGGEVE